MKIKRNLSGIYFRSKNTETNKWDNICFEDLSRDKQVEYLSEKPIEWICSLVLQLADTINEIGDNFDLTKG